MFELYSPYVLLLVSFNKYYTFMVPENLSVLKIENLLHHSPRYLVSKHQVTYHTKF